MGVVIQAVPDVARLETWPGVAMPRNTDDRDRLALHCLNVIMGFTGDEAVGLAVYHMALHVNEDARNPFRDPMIQALPSLTVVDLLAVLTRFGASTDWIQDVIVLFEPAPPPATQPSVLLCEARAVFLPGFVEMILNLIMRCLVNQDRSISAQLYCSVRDFLESFGDDLSGLSMGVTAGSALTAVFRKLATRVVGDMNYFTVVAKMFQAWV